MMAITIMAALLADFAFEVQVNKLRTYNSQDKLQARLNAEAGLKFAIARLELYQEARNFLEKNTNLQKEVKVEDLNTIWNVPFIYPIPTTSKMKTSVKASIEKFMKESLLLGEINTEIRNTSNLININLLRIAKPKVETKSPSSAQTNAQNQTTHGSSNLSSEQIILNLEKTLTDLFKGSFESRIENDEVFAAKYSNIQPELLIKEIKFYINDADKELEPEIDEIRAEYASKDIKAKHAPLSSLSELYLLDGWDDELLDLIKDSITVHGVVAIDLNKITEKTLKLLLPEIDEQGVKDFFEYRDDPESPKTFNNIDEFKSYIVSTADILNQQEMDKRIIDFQKAGIDFGVHGSLFRVISKGSSGRATYTISAYVEIPIKPVVNIDPNTQDPQDPDDNIDTEVDPDQKGQVPPRSTTQTTKPDPTQYLKPRVIEMTIN